MEFVIPGLILVALMVWASTRIKKNAAAAFDAETVETEEFVIEKPEGFLHVLNDDSGLAFRAYSKEFGTVGKKDVRKADIEIEIHREAALEAIREGVISASDSIENEQPYLDGGERSTIIAAKRIIDGGEFDVLTKLITRGSDVYEATARSLTEHSEEYLPKLEQAIERLRVK